MLLSRLELRNFRCFESLDLSLGPTTVLVGANDTGKSVVLEALAWLAGAVEADWSGAVRGRDHRERAGRVASIVGSITDFTPEEAEAFSAVLIDGTLRVGLASALGRGLHVILPKAAAKSLCDAVDLDAVNEAYEPDNNVTDRVAGLHLMASDETIVIPDWDDQIWMSLSIWELLSPAPYGLDLLDLDFLQAIVFGGARDTSWSPRSVLGPLLRDRLARLRDSPFPDIIPSAMLAPPSDAKAGALDNAYDRLNVAINDLMLEVSEAHTRTLAGISRFQRISWRYRFGARDHRAVRSWADHPPHRGTGDGPTSGSTARRREVLEAVGYVRTAAGRGHALTGIRQRG